MTACPHGVPTSVARPETAGRRTARAVSVLAGQERRVRDSNPRRRSLASAVFKTAAIGH